MSEEKTTYHLYGRDSYSQPLTFMTAVAVMAGDKPAIPAGDQWVEVIAFPETAVIRVIPRQKEKSA